MFSTVFYNHRSACFRKPLFECHISRLEYPSACKTWVVSIIAMLCYSVWLHSTCCVWILWEFWDNGVLNAASAWWRKGVTQFGGHITTYACARRIAQFSWTIWYQHSQCWNPKEVHIFYEIMFQVLCLLCFYLNAGFKGTKFRTIFTWSNTSLGITRTIFLRYNMILYKAFVTLAMTTISYDGNKILSGRNFFL